MSSEVFLASNNEPQPFQLAKEPDSRPNVEIGPPIQFSNRISRKLRIIASNSIPERFSWSNMTLLVVSGVCRVDLDGAEVTLRANDSINIPPDTEHRITAETDVKAIVTFDQF